LPNHCHKPTRLPPARSSPDRRWEQPHRAGKQLLPPLDDKLSARRGTDRVIYRTGDTAHILTVVDTGHRRDLYRTR